MSDSASEPARESAAAVERQRGYPSQTQQSQRAYRSLAAWMRFLTPAVIGLAADLWLKAWSFPDGVPPAVGRGAAIYGLGRNPAESSPPIAVIPHVLGFTTTVNRGAVFGMWQGYVLFFLAFSIVAMVMILWVFASSRRSQWIMHIALGMITAGALGNLYDRAVHDGVRDMLRFYVSWYPFIFNIADVMLCIGVPLLIVYWLFWGEKEMRSSSQG